MVGQNAPWMRLWRGASTDPKWRMVADAAGQPLPYVVAVWFHILDHAMTADPRGTLARWSDAVAAAAVGISPDAVRAIREAMTGLVIDRDGRLSAWNRRQPTREDDRPASRDRPRTAASTDAEPSAARDHDRETPPSVPHRPPPDVGQCGTRKTSHIVPLEERREEEIDKVSAAAACVPRARAEKGGDDDDAVALLGEVMEILGADPARSLWSATPLRAWLDDGATPEIVRAAAAKAASDAAATGRPIRTLAYLRPIVEQIMADRQRPGARLAVRSEGEAQLARLRALTGR